MKIKMKKTQNINENTEPIFKKSVYLKMMDIEEVDAGSLSCHEFVLKLGMNCCIK